MAQKLVYVDDIDGTEADVEHIEFSVDGTNYTIDLGPANAAKLREALAVYISHAQTTSGTSAPRRQRASSSSGGSAPATDKEQLQAMRQWAKKNGYGVSDRGRVSKHIRDAYEAAHQP